MHTWKKRFGYGLALLGGTTLLACGGAAVPQAQLTDAKESTSAAEAVGARNEPQAALHLKMAEDAIVDAEKHIANGDNDHAVPLLERARSDAELARAITHESKTKASADEAIAKLTALQGDIQKQAGRS